MVFGEKQEDDGRVEKPDDRTPDEKLSDLVDFYYKTFMLLSGEDALKIKEATELNVQEALFYLSYMVKKNREEQARYKKQKL